MRYFKMISIILLCLVLYFQTLSQNCDIHFKNLIAENNLPFNQVTDIIQDRNGFIWFSTFVGLFRYDGYTFIEYRHNPNQTNSLSSNTVKCMFLDGEGVLWIGTLNKGLNKYNSSSDDFTYYKNPFSEKHKDFEQILSICEDTLGVLWIGTAVGVNTFDKSKKKFLDYYHYEKEDTTTIRSSYVYKTYADLNGNIWIGTRNYISKFNRANNNFINYKLINTRGISEIYDDNKGGLWLGTADQGLIKFNRTDGRYKLYQHNKDIQGTLSHNSITKIISDKHNNLWIATEGGGINIFNYSNESFTHLKHDKYDFKSLVNNNVLVLFKDKTNVIWIGTRKGLSKLDNEQKPFCSRAYNFKKWSPILSKKVSAICKDERGNYWVATRGSLFVKYNVKTGKISKYNYKTNIENYNQKSKIVTLYYEKGYLWIGTTGDGLIRYNIANNNFKSFVLPSYLESMDYRNEQQSNFISNNHITHIYKDTDQNYWIGTWRGLNKLKFVNGIPYFTCYKYDPDNPNSISHRTITYIYEDTKRNLWFATLGGGLNKLTSKNRNLVSLQFERFQNKPNDPNSLNNNEINCLFECSNGKFWIGTRGGGLSKMDTKTKKFTSFPFDESGYKHLVTSILEDNNGNLWLGGYGLLKFDTKEKKYTYFTTQNGLSSNYFQPKSCYKNKDGSMLFGLENGILIFHPDSLKMNPFCPEPMITNISLFNKPIIINKKYNNKVLLNENICETKKIILSYKQNFISIYFSAMHFAEPDENQYSYMLEGFDNEWTYNSSDRRFATYTNLEPGKYAFKIKASNNDGIWSNSLKTLEIIVTPPWWKTWWFKFILIFSIGGGSFYFYRYRINQMKKRQLLLKHMVQERTKELHKANNLLKDKHEEIEIQSEELHVLNDNLKNQKEELEQTLFKLRETQTELIQAEKFASIRILTAGIAHEINNPLNFIQTGITVLNELISNNIGDNSSKIMSLTDTIQVGIDRTRAIVEKLIKFNKKSIDKKKSCNLNDIINRCISSFNSILSENIKIVRNYNTENQMIFGVESDLYTVFSNILTNSIHAISGAGRITISTKIENNIFNIEIEDTGCGIAPKNIKRITDPFFTTKAPGHGTGLGMSIALAIIHHHNGTVFYESVIDRGTKVKVCFPVK